MCRGKIQSILKTKWADVSFHAEGGNSYVFSARDAGGPIAIKVYRVLNNQHKYDRFVHEVKIMQTLNNIEGIAEILDFSKTFPKNPVKCDDIKTLDDIAYYTMHLFQGTLADIIPVLAAENDDGTGAVKIILQLARTIQRLHQRECAHRDFKPENVLHNNDGRYYISDYGLSIDLSDLANPEERLTPAGEQVGSLYYRAPELLRGRLDSSDHAPVDVFALGRTLWALVYGREPEGLTDFEFAQMKPSACGRTIRKPAQLDHILQAATHVDPRHRMNIDVFIESLENWKMENDPGSYEHLINGIVNDPNTRASGEFRKLVSGIRARHYETVQYVRNELDKLIHVWTKIAAEYQQAAGTIGNPCQVESVSHYMPDFNPDILGYERFNNVDALQVRFNLAIEVAPRLQIAVYFSTDITAWENQKYVVMAAYIPKDADLWLTESANSIMVTRSHTTKFNYQDVSIGQKIVNELSAAFRLLDDKLRASV